MKMELLKFFSGKNLDLYCCGHNFKYINRHRALQYYLEELEQLFGVKKTQR